MDATGADGGHSPWLSRPAERRQDRWSRMTQSQIASGGSITAGSSWPWPASPS